MEGQKLREARRMAAAHVDIDSDLKEVFLLESLNEDDPGEPIKLLEIVEGTMETGVEPVAFAPNPGLGNRFGSLIVEISPREFEAMREQVNYDGHIWRVTEKLAGQALAA